MLLLPVKVHYMELWKLYVTYLLLTWHLAGVGAHCLGPRSSDDQVNQHECWHSMLEVVVPQCKNINWQKKTAACDILDEEDEVAYSTKKWKKRGVAVEVSETYAIHVYRNVEAPRKFHHLTM